MPCTDLETRRAYARARHDASAVTDANILLRAHIGAAH
jgi:hypothetical protein